MINYNFQIYNFNFENKNLQGTNEIDLTHIFIEFFDRSRIASLKIVHNRIEFENNPWL